MCLKYCDSFIHLALKGLAVFQHVNQLRIVDLQQHACDLSSEFRIHSLNKGEQAFTQHLLLFLWGSSCQHGSCEWFLSLDKYSRLWLLLGNWLRSNHSHILSWIPNTWSIFVVSPWHILFDCSSLSCLCCRSCSLLIDCHHSWILSGSRSKMRWQLTSDTPHHCWHHLLTHWASNHSCSRSLGLIHSPWSSWATSSESWIHAHLHLTWWYSATWLLGPTGLSAAYICLSLIEEALWLWDRCLYKVALLRICHLLSHLLHAHSCNTLHILRSQVSFTVLFSLRKRNIQWLGHDDTSVHFSDCLCSLLWGRKANKPETLASALLAHNLGRSNGSEWSKFCPQSFVIDSIIQVLDIQVYSLESSHPFQLHLLELLFQFHLSLSFLLSASNVDSFTSHFTTIEVTTSSFCCFCIFIGNKSKAFV